MRTGLLSFFVFFVASAFTQARAEDDRFFAGNEGSPTRNLYNSGRDDRGVGSSSSGGYEFNTARRQGYDRGHAIPLPEGRRSGSSSHSSYPSSSGGSSSDNDPNTYGTSAYYLARQDEVRHSRNSDGAIWFFHNGRYYLISDSQQKKIDNIRYRDSSDHDRQVAQIIDIYSYHHTNPGVAPLNRPSDSTRKQRPQMASSSSNRPRDTIPLDVAVYSGGSYLGTIEYWRPIAATEVPIKVSSGTRVVRVTRPLEPGQTKAELYLEPGWTPLDDFR